MIKGCVAAPCAGSGRAAGDQWSPLRLRMCLSVTRRGEGTPPYGIRSIYINPLNLCQSFDAVRRGRTPGHLLLRLCRNSPCRTLRYGLCNDFQHCIWVNYVMTLPAVPISNSRTNENPHFTPINRQKKRAHNVRPAENHPFTVILHFPFSILHYFHFHSRTSGISSPYSVIYC